MAIFSLIFSKCKPMILLDVLRNIARHILVLSVFSRFDVLPCAMSNAARYATDNIAQLNAFLEICVPSLQQCRPELPPSLWLEQLMSRKIPKIQARIFNSNFYEVMYILNASFICFCLSNVNDAFNRTIKKMSKKGRIYIIEKMG